ncbi:MAG: putative toxin-antitoxin system toxin component, PIN family [Gammaproteobacteria bacterium]
MIRVVLDTNVFVSALRSGGGASREIVRRALKRELKPLFSNALWNEYEELLGRDVWTDATTAHERQTLLSALASVGEWVNIYYGWRPNLRDEGDNHLIELSIAGQADAVITHNVRDFDGADLSFDQLRILTPAQALEEL